jgi:hypothetical protein
LKRDYTTMDSTERARLIGGNLTKATDALVGAFRLTPEQHTALGDFLAAVLERVTERAVGKVVEQYRLAERVEQLEAREAGSEH